MAQPKDWVPWDGPRPPGQITEEDLNPIPVWDEENPEPVSGWMPSSAVAVEEASGGWMPSSAVAVEEDSGGWMPSSAVAVEDTAENKPTVSSLEAAGRGLRQGATLGFADEAQAGLGSLLDYFGGLSDSPMASYKSLRDDIREDEERAAAYHPVAYGAGNVAGMALPMLATGGGASIAGAAGRGAALGAGMGAGEAEEMSDIPQEALVGAGAGAVGGTVGQAGANLAGKALGSMMRGGGKVADVANNLAAKSVPKAAFDDAVLEGVNLGEYGLKDFFKTAGKETVKDIVKSGARRISPADLILGGAGFAAAGPIGAALGVASSSLKRGTGKAVTRLVQHRGSWISGNTSDWLLSNAGKLGKAGPAIKAAGERGGESVAITNYLLQQKDEKYRERVRKLQEEDERKEK